MKLETILTGSISTQFFWKANPTNLTAGKPLSYFMGAGTPGTATVAAAISAAGHALGGYLGQLTFPPIASGKKRYLANFTVMNSNLGGSVLLCDRLWHNVLSTASGSQTVNSVAWPARDSNGSTNGDQVLVGLEVIATTGAGTPTLTLGYTNSLGVAGHSATNTPTTVASAGVGFFWFFNLQAGDVGVRSVQSYQQSNTWTSGTICLVAYRVVAVADLATALQPQTLHPYTRLYDDSVLFLICIPTASTSNSLIGTLGYCDV